jgi:hypothetical protein
LSCIPGIVPGASPLAQDTGSIDPSMPLFDRSAFEPISTFAGQYYYGVGSRTTNFRTPGFSNTDLSIVKNIPFTWLDKPMRFQIRGEFFNIWNEHHFVTRANANGDAGGAFAFNNLLSDPNFGRWNGSVSQPRNIQLTARFEF